MLVVKMTTVYKKLSHREHILELPDTYLNSVETNKDSRWLYNSKSQKIEFKDIQFNPALAKCFDEILVNARDEIIRSKNVTYIDVKCGMVDGVYTITIKNDGSGIPIEYSKEKNDKGEFIYTPELIFGHLLTSGNYNKEEKIVGGKNGYGSKLSNIFSTRFTIETLHPASGKLYTQTWKDNMSICEKPVIKKSSSKGYVSVTFCPDVKRFIGAFKGAELSKDMEQVFHTRVLEIAAMAGKEVKVTYNDSEIKTNTFEKFVKLFISDEKNIAYEKCSERWEVAVILVKNLFQDDISLPDEKHISFVNGINTKKGGKHVDTVFKHVIGDFCDLAKKKKVDIKPSQLKDSLILFVNSTIVNPSFDSQTKETLTTPATKFGSVFKCSAKLPEALIKIGLLEEAQSILDAKAHKDAKKTDGTKKKTLRGMPKLVDALYAGTAKSSECTLILTEGDSAATSAISGLKVVGRELWGVFPLKGKMLNVRDISQDKFAKNEELSAIKKILGLEQKKVYKDIKSLRYGRIMVMADQDLDGSHIKGLLMNLFHAEWPSLMKSGFICSLMTPLLKASKKSLKMSFYTMADFEAWKAKNNDAKGWTIKYYKGLGTSTPEEAQDWFKNLHEVKYQFDKETDESFSLAFSKKRADDRKKWLGTFDSKRTLQIEHNGKVDYTRFIHDELIHFSNADNIRSLPSIMDGLKPSQRKILFGCLKRNLKSEVRVAQLAGYVSEHAAYHHGEASLNGAIVSMAQTFVGANNINLLAPVGQFGSRLQGGKDSASPRYIHTHLEPIVDKIFRKEDSIVLNYLDDDGLLVEPEMYYPVLPLILVNGCVGIGTGFSTDIPPHDPIDIVNLLKERLSGTRKSLENIALRPWWLGFKGPVMQSSNGVWVTKGLYKFNDDKKMVTITELPIGIWTHDYKEKLEEMCQTNDKETGKPLLKNYEDLYNHVDIRFDLYLDPDYYYEAQDNIIEFEKKFHLTSTWRTSNMVAFDTNMTIKKYDCAGDLMEEFYNSRIQKYEERRMKEINQLKQNAIEADAKARFLRGVLNDTIDLRRKSDEDIVIIMKKHNLPPISEPKDSENVDSYDYLLRLRIDRVKASAIVEAENAVMKAQELLKALENTTASQLWLSDLDEFVSSWDSMKSEREILLNSDVKAKVKKTKK